MGPPLLLFQAQRLLQLLHPDRCIALPRDTSAFEQLHELIDRCLIQQCSVRFQQTVDAIRNPLSRELSYRPLEQFHMLTIP